MRFFYILLVILTLGFFVLINISPVSAQCGTYVSPVRYYPPIYSPPYSPPVTYYKSDIVLVPFVQPVIVTPEYFFSVSEYYKSAVALELLKYQREALQASGVQSTSPSTTTQGVSGTPSPSGASNSSVPSGALPSTGINPRLTNMVSTSCIRCHGGGQTKGGLDLKDLASKPLSVRLDSYKRVLKGDMPRGGPRLSDQDTELFFEWSLGTSQVSNPRVPEVAPLPKKE